MSYETPFKALYNKYRPQLFADVVGQRHIIRILQNSLAHNRVSHAYLFSGDRGTGKTTVARILAKAVNCLEGVQLEPCNRCENCLSVGRESFLDLIEIDAASNTSVDDIRALREAVRYRPASGRYKVYLIDEVHQLSRAAYNAFLKTLEEPPEHAIFILATTDPHKVLQTVRSRCQHLRFRKHTHTDTVEELARVATGEDATFSKDALRMIARNSDGSLRDAIGVLDQALSYADDELTEELLREMLGITGVEAVAGLTDAIADGHPGRALTLIDEAVQDGANPATLQQELVEYFRGLLVVRTGRKDRETLQFSESEVEQMADQAVRFRVGQLVRCIELLTEGGVRRRAGFSPQLDLELAAVQACLMVAAENGQAEVTEGAVASGNGAAAAEAAPEPAYVSAREDESPEPATDPPQPKASPPPVQSVGAVDIDLDRVRAAVREWNPLYVTYFDDASVARDGNLVVFELIYDGHRDALSKPDNLQRLRDIVKEITGEMSKIEYRLKSSSDADPVDTAPADDLVNTAVKMYGAKVIEEDRPV